MSDDEPMQWPIDGMLDLHTFQSYEVKELIGDHLTACRARGILRLRIIHGKSICDLRRTTHAVLAKHLEVVEFHLAGEPFGGWGATIVHLRNVPAGEIQSAIDPTSNRLL